MDVVIALWNQDFINRFYHLVLHDNFSEVHGVIRGFFFFKEKSPSFTTPVDYY